jgi:hypothetical protein
MNLMGFGYDSRADFCTGGDEPSGSITSNFTIIAIITNFEVVCVV